MQGDAAEGVGVCAEQKELIMNCKGGAVSGQPLCVDVESSPERVESYHTLLGRHREQAMEPAQREAA